MVEAYPLHRPMPSALWVQTVEKNEVGMDEPSKRYKHLPDFQMSP